ncbi:MAG TPA: hypothetical protein VJ825_09085 [Gemmatimonadaceae bacterium]|nr:hypothetical protein [Gemmatimonadaceae bacterium]
MLPVGSGTLRIIFDTDPSAVAVLPHYAEQVIAELRVDGTIAVNSQHESKQSSVVDARGYWREDSIHGCYVEIRVHYSVQGDSYLGNCAPGTLQSLRVDTIRVNGDGEIRRTGPIAQWGYECDFQVCWKYQGSQDFLLTPIPVPINLVVAQGATEVSPGVIDIPAAGTGVVFQVRASPVSLKGMDVPVRLISWAWTPKAGGDHQTIDNCTGRQTIQCSMTFYEAGMLIAKAAVNGVEQSDTVRVRAKRVLVTPATHQMRYTQGWWQTGPPRKFVCNQPSKQTLSVSVLDENDVPINFASVALRLFPAEGTAGHLHTGGKPPGSLDSVNTVTIKIVSTGSTGAITVPYVAPKISGTVTIKGTNSNALTGVDTVSIGVLGLTRLEPGPHYVLVGEIEGQHIDNHWVTDGHKARLMRLADWFASWWKPAVFNDSSLPQGGFYDVEPGTVWDQPHATHSDGEATDFGIKDLVTGQKMPRGVYRVVELTWQAWGGKVNDESDTKSPHLHLGQRAACH